MCVAQDYEEGHLYALEKFWAFHQYSGLPKGSGVSINPKVTPFFSTSTFSDVPELAVPQQR